MPRCSLAAAWGRLASLVIVAVVLLASATARAGEPLAFELVSDETPKVACPGEVRPVTIRIRNAGDEAWDPATKDRLAYHWLSPEGEMVVRDGARTPLPRDVAPGESIELDARLEAPAQPGEYRLAWAMVRESVRWYPRDGVPTRTVTVAEADAPPLAYALEIDRVPAFEAGETHDVDIYLKNTGCGGWRTAWDDAVSYHWRDAAGTSVVAEGLRTPLPDVGPGQTASLAVRVAAPLRPGTYVLELEPVREGLTWFGAGGPSAWTEVEVVPGPLRWSLTAPLQLPPLHAKQAVTVPVSLHNDGEIAWSTAAGDRISYRFSDDAGQTIGEGIRTPLPHRVAPGESVVVDLRVAAPAAPGTYRFAPEPVREFVRWFGPPANGDAHLHVEVQSPELAFSIVDVDAPSWFWVGRTETVQVTVRNEGARAWRPEAADRLSYRWRDASGVVVVPEGRRTPIPRVVEPGDTVTVQMHVVGPATSGDYVLALDMVREHVSWFGGPLDDPESATIEIGVYWESTILGGLLAGLVALVIGAARHARTASAVRRTQTWVWPVWLGLCAWLLAEAFADLSGLEFWGHGRLVSISCGALLGAVLAAMGTTFPRAVRPIALTVATLIGVLVLADLAYAKFFGSLVPLTALAAAHHLVDAGGSVVSLIEPVHVWVLSLPLTGLALAWGLAAPDEPDEPTRWRRFGPVLGLGIAALPCIVAVGAATTGELGRKVYSEARNAGRLGVVAAHVFQLARAVDRIGGRGTLDAATRAEVTAFYEERVRDREQARGDGAFEAARGANLVLIQVEALQYWAMTAEVDGQPIMPFLQAAPARALVFDAVFDQTAQGRTSDAEYLALASNHALAEGALSFLREDASFVTVGTVLRDAGYATLSAHPYRRGFWNRAALHPRYGFETSIFERELGRGPEVGWGLADGPFLETMADRLRRLPEPFFAFLITLSLHHPYDDFPAGLRELDLGTLEDTWVGNYLHAMHHFDGALAAFFERLEADGRLDHTVVVIYGDHVTGMGEPPAVLELAGVPAWEPSTPTLLGRVPVVVWIPGGAAHGHRDRVGGQIDIGPTVLHLLGAPVPRSFVGRPLTTAVPFVALPDGGAATEDRVLVVQGEGTGERGACFDADGGTARPREDCDEIEARAQRELAMSRALLDHDLFAAP